MSTSIKSIKFSFDADNIPVSLRGDGIGFCTFIEAELSDGRTASSQVFIAGNITPAGMLYGMHEAYDSMQGLLAKEGIAAPARILPSDALGIAMYEHMSEVAA